MRREERKRKGRRVEEKKGKEGRGNIGDERR